MIVRPIVVAALFISLKFYAQEQPQPKTYKPTEVQSLRLQVRHKDAELALVQMQVAQRQYNSAMSELVAEGERVKVENSWPKEVHFDPDSNAFSMPKEEVKKP